MSQHAPSNSKLNLKLPHQVLVQVKVKIKPNKSWQYQTLYVKLINHNPHLKSNKLIKVSNHTLTIFI